MLILEPYGTTFDAVVVFGLGLNFFIQMSMAILCTVYCI